MLALALAALMAAPADTTDLPHYPASVAHVEVDGRALAVVDTGGEGVPVVLVHGLGTNLSIWRETIPALEAAGRRAVALDLPGYGLSAKDGVSGTMPGFAAAVAGTMDALGIAQADVVGLSMGGQIAMTLALEHPARVRRLGLLSPAGIETFTAQESAMLTAIITPEAVQNTTPAQAAANTAANFHAYDEARDGWILEQREAVAARDDFPLYAAANAASVAGMLDGRVIDRVGEIAAPTLVVYGAGDRLIPNAILHPDLTTEAVAEAAGEAIAHAEVHVVPEAGHLVMLEQPEAVHALLVGFLGE
ncbi:MAG: alpha/beta fold hydrolase [Bacteroidota bacterium]